MSNKYNQNLLIGAAVAAGILGTLTGLLGVKKTNKGWAGQAKDLLDGEMVNKNMVLGGVAGGLVGAAAALLLAPKSGAELIKDIAHPFTHEGTSKRSTSRKSASHKKSSSRSTKGKSSRKTSEKKEHHASATRKPAARRRTAAAAPKAAATSHEKETVSEAKEA
jgi:gas vesicle protein